jgi:hypothetical protein
MSSVTLLADERNVGSHEGLKVSVLENAGESASLLVKLPKSSTPQVTKLENPARLVLDIPGLSTNNNKTLTLADNEPVKSIRVGRHPNNTRIVFDLKNNSFPEYSLENNGTQIALKFDAASGATVASAPKTEAKKVEQVATSNTTSNTATPMAAPKLDIAAAPAKEEKLAALTPPVVAQPKVALEPKKELAPIAEPKKEIAPIKQEVAKTTTPVAAVATTTTPLSESSPAKIHSAQPEVASPKGRLDTKTLVETPSAATAPAQVAALNNLTTSERQVAGTPQVNKIAFERDPASNVMMIKISLSQRTPYTLSRTGQRAYRLALPGTIFADENLTLPHFPPQDFKGVTLVNPERSNGQVEFFIGVERDIKLASFANENEIWIKVDNSK